MPEKTWKKQCIQTTLMNLHSSSNLHNNKTQFSFSLLSHSLSHPNEPLFLSFLGTSHREKIEERSTSLRWGVGVSKFDLFKVGDSSDICSNGGDDGNSYFNILFKTRSNSFNLFQQWDSIMTKASKGRERWTMGNGWGSNYAGPSTICPKHCSRSHDLFYSLFKHLQKETIFFPNNNYQISFLFLVFEFVLDFSKHKKAAFGCYS